MIKLITQTGAKDHKVVSHSQWIAARKALLVKEKKFTRLRDQLSRLRRNLPWERVDKEYIFDGPDGKESLSGLFEKKRQLIVYHFMFGPGWKEGCPHCSFWADNFNPLGIHLKQRDITMVAISRAPFAKIRSFKKRMTWKFKWLSSINNDFNFDYGVSFSARDVARKSGCYNYKQQDPLAEEREGVSVFYQDEKGEIFHTYSTYARGIDLLNTAYNYVDLTTKGRDEDPENSQDWVRFHDKY